MHSSQQMLPRTLADLRRGAHPPLLLDVRRRAAFEASRRMIAGACWRDPALIDEWKIGFAPGSEVVVYCVHGQNVSQMTAAALRARGVKACVLAGGIEAYIAAGGMTLLRAALPPGGEAGGSRWVTGERPALGGLACSWLVRRFVDPQAEFHFVEEDWVQAVTDEIGGMTFGIPDVAVSEVAERGRFDGMLEGFGLADPALERLARIVRAAGTAKPHPAPQAAGLLAVSQGLLALHDDDLAALEQAVIVFDALHAWCRQESAEGRDGQPETEAGSAA